MNRKITYFIPILLPAFTVSAFGAKVLIWDNDNNIPFYSSDEQVYEYCFTDIEEALVANGHKVVVSQVLPDDLSSYDVVFVILGFYCPA